jgi:hypothetical protein
MTNNISPVAFTNGTVANGGTITVPANVAATHLGIAVLASTNQYSVGSVPTLPSWSNKVSDPSIANQMEWNVLTRNGGLRAGDTIPVTVNNGTTFAYYILWYDTSSVGPNLDVNLVGTPGGRGTTNSAFTVVNGINAVAGQQIIVVASEKSTATGTNVTGFSGNYTPSTDAYAEDVGGTNTSAFFGHFAPTASGATGTVTLNYSTSSGNGVGVLLALGTPKTDSFHDPFTNPHYSTASTPPGLWQGLLSETASPMGGGLLKMALTTDYAWVYPQMQLDFNNSSFTTEVYMDNVVQGSFSMRLTTDASPQSNTNFVSCGIAAGGGLYMNHRVGSVDNVTNYAVTVAAGQAVVLRLRNAGSTTVYFDYSWDYQNWTTLGSKSITCFNPQTDLPRPMFQAGSPVDHFDQFANVTQMNTNVFLSPPSARVDSEHIVVVLGRHKGSRGQPGRFMELGYVDQPGARVLQPDAAVCDKPLR